MKNIAQASHEKTAQLINGFANSIKDTWPPPCMCLFYQIERPIADKQEAKPDEQ